MGFGYSVRKPEYCFNPKLHSKGSKKPFSISRSKIDLFVECAQCFFLDQRFGIKRPDSFPLTLNNAVDELMKREFDLLRTSQSPHPLMKKYGIDAVPFAHPDLETWRDALKAGVGYLEPTTNLFIRGGIDDVWINSNKELHIVDYKATSKKEKVSLDAAWQDAYKRQVEVYQWLFRKNNFAVSPIAYFVYANGDASARTFDGKLDFETTIISYKGDDQWIESTIVDLHRCLMDEAIPKASVDCSYCAYRQVAGKILYIDMLKKRGSVSPRPVVKIKKARS